jgi:uncharacterized protein (TIGR00297 family)
MALQLHSPASDLAWCIITFLLLFGLVALSELIRKKFSVKPETTRKLVHILTGVFVFLSPYIFYSPLPVLIIPALYIPFNLLGVRYGWMKSLHGIENAKSYGTVYYPIAFFILVLLCWDKYTWVMQTAMLVLAFGDAAAAIVGESWKSWRGSEPIKFNFMGDPKSLQGSVTMFVVSAILVGGSLAFLTQNTSTIAALSTPMLILLCLSVALVATAVEALLSGGSDNLFIPLTVAYVLWFAESHGVAATQHLVFAAFISLAFVLVVYIVKFLNAAGCTATFLLACNIYGMGDLEWLVPMLTFFILSSILSKVGKKRKKKYDLIFEKSSTRDAAQVFANGGMAWLVLIVWSFLPQGIKDYSTYSNLLYYAYLGTLATVNADTWATEIGTLIPNARPISIVTFRHVPAGTSGGVSIGGTLGGLLGAIVIGWSAWPVNPAAMQALGSWFSIVAVGGAGLVGCLADSVLGATLQAQYYNEHTDKVTERTHYVMPSGQIVPNRLIKGYAWIDNDMVNLSSSVAGTLFIIWIVR